jgi:small ligand-binding sensory domain FIST
MTSATRFICGHATHPHWAMAAGLVVTQLKAQLDTAQRDAHSALITQPNVALVYATDAYAPHAQALLDHLRQSLPTIAHWCGTVGVGVCSSGVEYFDEPGLVVMLCEWPQGSFQVFNGISPLGQQAPKGFVPQAALVHADPMTPMLGDLIQDVADLTTTGELFGGLCASRHGAVQFAVNGWDQRPTALSHSGVFEGGLSGLAFGQGVGMVCRVTQGCQPLGPTREITRASGHVVEELGGRPALEVLMDELGVTLDDPERAVAQVRRTLVGVSRAALASPSVATAFGEEVMVRHIIGLDPGRDAVAIADEVEAGMQLSFCHRDVAAARADLRRMATQVRDVVESLASTPAGEVSAAIRGAVYVSCSGRGGPHFGAPHAELHILREALGDIPLVGFFAAGEIAHRQIHGYTGVLTVFISGVE